MIHSSAVISHNSTIHETSNIGPFCVIGDGVNIGKNNNLISHVSITGNTNIDFNNGHYQIVTVTGSITLTLTNWAASGKLCKLRLELKGNSESESATVTFSAGSQTIKLDQGFLLSDSTQQGQMTNPFTVDPGKDYIIDFWTHNGGLTVYADLVGSFA